MRDGFAKLIRIVRGDRKDAFAVRLDHHVQPATNLTATTRPGWLTAITDSALISQKVADAQTEPLPIYEILIGKRWTHVQN